MYPIFCSPFVRLHVIVPERGDAVLYFYKIFASRYFVCFTLILPDREENWKSYRIFSRPGGASVEHCLVPRLQVCASLEAFLLTPVRKSEKRGGQERAQPPKPGQLWKQRGLEQAAAQRVKKPTAEHNLGIAGSNSVPATTSDQSPLCDHAFLCSGQKRRHPPAPLLPFPNCDPLRLAHSWQAALRAALVLGVCIFFVNTFWHVLTKKMRSKNAALLGGTHKTA